MRASFYEWADLLPEIEGGYVDDPRDPGGATNRGITLATYRQVVHSRATKADLRAMTESTAHTIYLNRYWMAIKGDSLPAGLDIAVMDYGVNSGPVRAQNALRDLVGNRSPDWSQYHKADILKFIDSYTTRRMAFLMQLKTWRTFGKGWSRRVHTVETLAKRLATQ